MNPYALRAESGFWPVAAARQSRAVSALTADGPTIRLRGETLYHRPLDALSARIENTRAAGRGARPVLNAEGGIDPFDPAAFDPVTESTAGPPTLLSDRADDPGLVPLDCRDESGQQAWLWIVAPAIDTP